MNFRALVAALVLVSAPSLGAEPPDWQALSDQAIARYRAGDFAGAEAAATAALEAATAQYGPDHPAVATGLNNLAAVYRAEKKYAEAAPLYERALALREKTLPPDHPDVAVSLNNLAVLYDAQDQFERAEPLYKRALASRERSLPPDHPDLAASLSNLGELYLAQRRFDRAEPLLVRAYDIRAKALDHKHPDFLRTQRDLWSLYMSTEKFALAEEYHPEGEVTPNESTRRRMGAAASSPKGNDPTVRGR